MNPNNLEEARTFRATMTGGGGGTATRIDFDRWVEMMETRLPPLRNPDEEVADIWEETVIDAGRARFASPTFRPVPPTPPVIEKDFDRSVLKKRHLNRDERRALHKPAADDRKINDIVVDDLI